MLLYSRFCHSKGRASVLRRCPPWPSDTYLVRFHKGWIVYVECIPRIWRLTNLDSLSSSLFLLLLCFCFLCVTASYAHKTDVVQSSSWDGSFCAITNVAASSSTAISEIVLVQQFVSGICKFLEKPGLQQLHKENKQRCFLPMRKSKLLVCKQRCLLNCVFHMTFYVAFHPSLIRSTEGIFEQQVFGAQVS